MRRVEWQGNLNGRTEIELPDYVQGKLVVSALDSGGVYCSMDVEVDPFKRSLVIRTPVGVPNALVTITYGL